MGRLKEVILAVIIADAQDVTPGRLGQLLGHSGASPYGVYFMSPPGVPDFPLITFSEMATYGFVTVEEAYNIQIWCDNYEAIEDRLYELLHRKTIGDATDIHPVAVSWDWSGPPVYDDDHKIYVKAVRYLAKGIKE